MNSIIPAPAAVIRQGLALVGAALVAALILNQAPAVRDFIRRNLWS